MKQAPPPHIPLYEVVDTHNQPLLYMPFASILRQRLYFKLAAVVYFLRDNRLLLQARNCQILPHQGLWDIYTIPVLAGQSYLDTAFAAMSNKPIAMPEKLSSITPQPVEREATFSSLFKATMPATAHHYALEGCKDFLLVDEDELQGLTSATPELFTPEVLWAASYPIFSHKTHLENA